ncbi:MAG: YbaK/EbsC family protein [Gammaproteobacteria bacterium]
MAISLALLEYLEWEGVDYELVPHPFVAGSMQTAQQAHIPGNKLAKCVVVEDSKGYLMTVLPATHHVDMELLKEITRRDLHLANEKEITDLFDDCSKGAIPPLPEAFGYKGLMDRSLDQCDEIYLEAGDHTELVHLSGDDFKYLMANTDRATFSYHM